MRRMFRRFGMQRALGRVKRLHFKLLKNAENEVDQEKAEKYYQAAMVAKLIADAIEAALKK